MESHRTIRIHLQLFKEIDIKEKEAKKMQWKKWELLRIQRLPVITGGLKTVKKALVKKSC